MERLFQMQPLCENIPQNEIVALAMEFVHGGCTAGSALWIAIKFLATQMYTPDAELMASVVMVDKETLLDLEAADLKHINWNIMKFAKQSGLILHE